MGYDISNYNAIHAPYGTLEDFDALIAGCHARGLRIMCDLVINHTSSEHAWFLASRSSKVDPKRDWYIWRPARYDAAGNRQPPNNWRSFFSESAWEWDAHTGEYYLHLFAVGQPDLNWDNAECRAAIIESAVVFWLERGVDGFRIDTAALYSKPAGLPDAEVTEPGAEHQPAEHLYSDGPMLEAYLRELGAVFAKYDAVTVGEFGGCPLSRSLRATSAADPQMSMNFHFGVCDFGRNLIDRMERAPPAERRLSALKQVIAELQTHTEDTDSWPTFFLENHDQARSISRYANDAPQWRSASGKMLACLMASMSGTLYLYQGQEIGHINFSPEWPLEEYKDISSLNYVALRERQAKDDGGDEAAVAAARAAAMAGLAALARDHARTPVQWGPGPHAGFTAPSGPGPWMRVADSYHSINAADSERDAGSVLQFYRRALGLRREHIDVLGHGLFRLGDAENDATMVYAKVGRGDRLALVMLNFTTEEQRVEEVPTEATGRKFVLALGTAGGEGEQAQAGPVCPWPCTLAPLEGRIYLAVGEGEGEEEGEA